MSPQINLEEGRSRRWRAVIVLIAVCALTVSVATRYTAAENVSAQTVKSLDKHSSLETSRQRLTKVAATWMPALVCFIMLQAPTSYPRLAAAGPPMPRPALEKSLYNRPPPGAEPL